MSLFTFGSALANWSTKVEIPGLSLREHKYPLEDEVAKIKGAGQRKGDTPLL